MIAQEEIFGPVLSVIAADDEADAVRIANDTIFGLHGAVFTADVERAREVAGQMRTGAIGHNGFKSDFDMGHRRVQAVRHRPRGRHRRAPAVP